MSDEQKLKALKSVDFRIGERLYTFNSFDDGCKAIAIYSRFIGYQNDLEKRMRDENIPFKHSNLEYENPPNPKSITHPCQCNLCVP